jgi:hypothetical protein
MSDQPPVDPRLYALADEWIQQHNSAPRRLGSGRIVSDAARTAATYALVEAIQEAVKAWFKTYRTNASDHHTM